MDNGTEVQRRQAREILDWENGCGVYFTGRAKANDTLTASILSELGAFLQDIRANNPGSYKRLLSELRHCATAECIAAAPTHTTKDLPYAKNKSVLFALLGFRFAASGCLSREEERLCSLVGEIMSVVDDLCDLDEDVKHGQINSIFCKAGNWFDLLPVIDEAFQRIELILNQLHEGFSREFYEYLLYELRVWSLDNEYIRSKVWRSVHG